MCPVCPNYLIEVSTNELGTDEILIRIGARRCDEAFAKEIKDLFRSKVRVAPGIRFESPEAIAKTTNAAYEQKNNKIH